MDKEEEGTEKQSFKSQVEEIYDIEDMRNTKKKIAKSLFYIAIAIGSVILAYLFLTLTHFGEDNILYSIASEGDKLLVEINGWLNTNIVLPKLFIESYMLGSYVWGVIIMYKLIGCSGIITFALDISLAFIVGPATMFIGVIVHIILLLVYLVKIIRYNLKYKEN